MTDSTRIEAPSTGLARLAETRAARGLVAALALALVVLVYSNHFDNAFQFNDAYLIEQNPHIRSLANPGRFFSDPTTTSTDPTHATFRPLTTLSYALDHAIAGGLERRQMRLTQLALLLLTGAALYSLTRRLLAAASPAAGSRSAALFGALLFCVHTANSEAVNYLSVRSRLLATLAVVAALAVATRPSRPWRAPTCLALFVAGLLCDPLALALAPLLFLLTLLESPERGLARRAGAAALRALPAALLALAYVLLRARVEGAQAPIAIDRQADLLTQPYVWLHYARLFVVPLGLTADNDWTRDITWYDTRLWVGLAFVATLAALAVALARWRALTPAALGLAWAWIALLHTSAVPAYEVYAEHRPILAYAGLALATACAVRALGAKLGGARGARARGFTTLLALAALAVLCAHALGTRARNAIWHDPLSLWSDVAAKSPRNGRAHLNHALALMERGDHAQALVELERARSAAPEYPNVEVTLALAMSALGRRDEAEPHFRRALALAPRFARGRFFYARWLVDPAAGGRGPEAIDQLEQALAITPADVEARTLLAHMYAALGAQERLAALARETLALAPLDPVAGAYAAGRLPHDVAAETGEDYARVGFARASAGLALEAAIFYGRAVALGVDTAAAWGNLGWARARLGFPASAVPCLERALALVPGDGWVERELAQARARVDF